MSKDTPNFRGHFCLTTKRRKTNKKVQKWRVPRGIDRSLSTRRGKKPSIGYSHPKEIRGNHPQGLKEILIRSKTDLENIADQDVLIRFSSTLGAKKKAELKKIALEKKIKTLN